jgi:hypothetical protein
MMALLYLSRNPVQDRRIAAGNQALLLRCRGVLSPVVRPICDSYVLPGEISVREPSNSLEARDEGSGVSTDDPFVVMASQAEPEPGAAI